MFAPRAVAVVGAGRSPRSIGYQVVRNLLDFGFRGPVYPVNPKADEILEQRCYPGVEALPDGVDLAVLVLPARVVAETVRACHARGIRAVVTISAGFRETGDSGATLEDELRDTLRELGVRMAGPNCMGIINTDPAVRLNATFAFTQPLEGTVAFASQSGSIGEAILSHAATIGLGLSAFVSVGNATDLTSEDLISHWADDPRTRVILLYLENLGDAHLLMERALIATRGARKPILAVKSGRTRAGARAASSHTGALAGRDQLTDVAFERSGIVRVDEIYDLFTVAKAFATQPLPGGPRVAILSNAGGPGIQATDATAYYGLKVGTLTQETKDRMAAVLPPGAALDNPVDMIATAGGENFQHCAAALLADPGIDALLLIYVTPVILDTEAVATQIVAGIRQGLGEADRAKSVVTCVMGKSRDDPGERVLREAGFPVYPFPEHAIQALAKMNQFARWLDEPEGEVPYLDVDAERVWTLLQDQPAGWLDGDTAVQVLRAYGIPAIPSRRVTGPDDAVAFAAEHQCAVALKVDSDAIPHKTDVGGVALDLRHPEAIREAFETIEAALGPDAPEHGYRVQCMAGGGVETIVGVTLDPHFGHVIMFGLGGTAVEVLGDVRFEMLPVTTAKARRMIAGIRGRKILDGLRGKPPVDRSLLEDVIVRVGMLAADNPRIVELDLNPLLAHPDRRQGGVIDVRIRLAPPNGEGSGD